MSIPDRIAQLKTQTSVTAIDFISVDPATQTTLEVHFYIPPSTLGTPLQGTLLPSDADTLRKFRIYSPTGAAADVPVEAIAWNGEILTITTSYPGGFALYKLRIDSAQLDPYYNDLTFSFKAGCSSDLDCRQEEECPPEAPVEVHINYLARDFWSFRQALLEFASLRYPDWPDRLEADTGVMLVEVMSALGDEMAYYQDRISREAYLETATQRRSLRRHARLVDYQLHDGLGANVWMDITARLGLSGGIPAGTDVWAANDNGSRTEFEIGRGLLDSAKNPPTLYPVDSVRNTLAPHIWDENAVCLPVGSTSIYVVGHVAGDFPPNDQIEGLPGQVPGRWFLLRTNPPNPAQPARTHLVRVIKMTELEDLVLSTTQITQLSWTEEQALPFDLDLAALEVRGNLLPATAGRTFATYYIVGAVLGDFTPGEQLALRTANDFQEVPSAVERSGPDGSTAYLFTLPGSEQTPLVWLGPATEWAAPEVVLQEMEYNAATFQWDIAARWTWKRSLIGTNSSQSEELHFTLESGNWQRVIGYQRPGETVVHQDYAADAGATIRFGDGEFGRIPAAKTVFRAYYRLGGGRRSNVSAATLNYMSPMPAFVSASTNPIHAFGGLDAEVPDEMRQLAPEAFRAVTFRAVRPEDYAEAAERLPWVQRAGATLRWTGSWLSAFVTPDPRGIVILEDDRRLDLHRQMDRFRQAGREVNVQSPQYADIDLEIELCIAPEAYSGEVKERVLELLIGKKGVAAKPGYFSADHFTFGSPLRRSALEALIQSAVGMNAVKSILYRRRGWFSWRPLELAAYHPGDNTIIRIENDPLNPERGSVRLKIA